MAKVVQGQIVDIYNRRIFPGEISIENGIIAAIHAIESAPELYIMPGFIDAHIHIESSMLVPHEFARVALTHGTIATVSDPHEIANVLGVEGVKYMIENAKEAKLKFHFGAPSCVPATNFETAGAQIDAEEVRSLLQLDEIYYLSEMMNYPGVLYQDAEVLKKISYAKEIGKPIDGHAPGLKGEKARQYIMAGISTDHECFTLAEALDKLKFGMKIIIREGSAAKNYNALHTLISSHNDRIMFCSDDKHPDDLMDGHINQLVVRSLQMGYELFDVLQIACINPVDHYKLRSGTMRTGECADFIIVENLKDFNVRSVFIDGEQIVDAGNVNLSVKTHGIINSFDTDLKDPIEFGVRVESNQAVPVIQAIDGALITEKLMTMLPYNDGKLQCDPERDILKIAVVNRYKNAPISLGFIQNFGLKSGAIASTVAHDSHNIIVVGINDEDMARAVNLLITSRGGLSAVSSAEEKLLQLPIAGLMSDKPCSEVALAYSEIDKFVKWMGSTLTAPYMTLSFMALLVIPKIKISDLGMFDAEEFKFY